MLFAQADPTTTVVIGLSAIIALAGGLFGMAVAIKTLFFARTDPDKQFVTRGELALAVSGLDDKIDDLKGKIEKSADDAKLRAHEQAQILHSMGLKLERLLALRDAEAENRNQNGK